MNILNGSLKTYNAFPAKQREDIGISFIFDNKRVHNNS
jgi:hypothetical protein